MRNVQDIMYDKGLYHILSDRVSEKEVAREVLDNTVVGIYLYYPDTLEKYFEYIKRIPQEIKVYIISANAATWEKIEQFVCGKSNLHFLKKENRGRDISALLVTFREIALKYKFFCFIHDKKEITEYLKQDTEFWVQNLWDNSLISKEYINNVLALLGQNNMGLLVPPEPIGYYKNDWYSNVWLDNFDKTREIAEQLEIQCNMVLEKSPITLGTVFWAKTDAMKKLLEKEWEYEDFPEEPVPNDGTISHAVERILAYVAQDAGYDTGIIMCNSYAEKLILRVKMNMTKTYDLVGEYLGVKNLYQVEHYKEQKEVIECFFNTYKKIYLYGAGERGKEFLHMLSCMGYCPTGFVVSDGKKNKNFLNGYPILELKDLEKNDNIGIFITVSQENQTELEENLKNRGLNNYFKPCLA